MQIKQLTDASCVKYMDGFRSKLQGLQVAEQLCCRQHSASLGILCLKIPVGSSEISGTNHVHLGAIRCTRGLTLYAPRIASEAN